MRKHLYTDHIGDWVESCKSLNISVNTAAALEAVQKYNKEPAVESERLQYSKEAFIDAIVDFVVGDDLVKFFISFDNLNI